MELIELTLPESWACALMYGDESGLHESDCDAIERLTKEHLDAFECFHCVDIQESCEFMTYHDAHHIFPFASTVARYTFDIGKKG